MITWKFHMYVIWCAKDMEAAFLAIHYNIVIGLSVCAFRYVWLWAFSDSDCGLSCL